MYYNKNTDYLFIPRNSIEDYTNDEVITFSIYSVSTNQNYEFEVIDIDSLYYCFKFDVKEMFTNIQNGMYKYFLETKTGKLLSTGMLFVIDDEKSDKKYVETDTKIKYID